MLDTVGLYCTPLPRVYVCWGRAARAERTKERKNDRARKREKEKEKRKTEREREGNQRAIWG